MSTTRKDWLKWVAVTCALVATASAEYALAVAAQVPAYVAWTVPGALDAYLLRALQAQREVFTAVLAVIGVNVLSHLVHAQMLPVEWWTIAIVGAVPALVLHRVHALRTPAEARLDTVHDVPAGTFTERAQKHPACSNCGTMLCDWDGPEGGHVHAPGNDTPCTDPLWDGHARVTEAQSRRYAESLRAQHEAVYCVHDRPVTGTCWECDRTERFPVTDPVPGWDGTVTFDEHVSSVPVPVPDYVPETWGPSVHGGHEAVPVLEDCDCLDPEACTAEEPCPRCDRDDEPSTVTPLPLPEGFVHAPVTEVLRKGDAEYLDQARELYAAGTAMRDWKPVLGVGTPRAQRLYKFVEAEHAGTEGGTP